ncbi:MATE family efflux transporter [Nannocystis sp.]|uniref:MATE family efflux transporter n=1 Tax=Nannocystis sp. TaxID=1962667 RepID=UPI0025E3D0FD|nr:MATE family efflux transporter [Nannocystis sp.]MBK7830357.1 MATE family efflux transporter [Nannocystis sp.]
MSEASAELRRLSVLATPIVAAQVGTMMLGVVDTIMVGGIGSDALAAVALGTVWVFGTLVFGLGVTLGIDPLLTQAHGAGDGAAVGLTMQRGLVVAALASLPIAMLWLWTGDMLLLAGQSPALARMAHDYVLVQLPSVPAFLGFVVLRSYLQGRSIVAPTLWVTLIANLLNVAFNWVLIHGELGFPRLGLTGAGIATGVTRTLMFVLLALVIWRRGLHRGAWQPWSRAALEPAGLRQIARLGLPVGLQLGLEMWAFQVATLMAGWLGKAELAAHTVVLNLASMAFMLPLGISMAAVTRVGNLLGAGQPRAAQRAAWVALAMGAGVMCGSALGFVALRGWLPRVYSGDPQVLALAAVLLPIAGAFQLFDGTQVVGGGVLRGMGRTRPAALFNLLGYYVLGLPVAYYLAFEAGMGVAGIWWGLTVGLMAVALLLVAWVGVRGPATLGSGGAAGPVAR